MKKMNFSHHHAVGYSSFEMEIIYQLFKHLFCRSWQKRIIATVYFSMHMMELHFLWTKHTMKATVVKYYQKLTQCLDGPIILRSEFFLHCFPMSITKFEHCTSWTLLNVDFVVEYLYLWKLLFIDMSFHDPLCTLHWMDVWHIKIYYRL